MATKAKKKKGGKETPLMKQYNSIKQKNPDTLLLFRLGDFFETFGDDAVTASKVCGLTLTKRNNGSAGEMPLAGFPHHQLDNYLPRLVRAGHRVAVCEQVEDPKQAKGIVKRDVVEVVTPGVVMNEKLLDANTNNYVVAVFKGSGKYSSTVGAAFADVSTGVFETAEMHESMLPGWMDTLVPSEILVSRDQRHLVEALPCVVDAQTPITRLETWLFGEDYGVEQLCGLYGVSSVKGFGVEHMPLGIAAAGAVVHYLNETQKQGVKHMLPLRRHNVGSYMVLDASTRRNLEIAYSLSGAGQHGTLIKLMDKTCTSMGGRLLKQWLTRPLTDLSVLTERQEAVQELSESTLRGAIRECLQETADLERLVSKVCTGRATPRDLKQLSTSLKQVDPLQEAAATTDSSHVQKTLSNCADLSELIRHLDTAIAEDPPLNPGSGGVFRSGFHTDLDAMINVRDNSKGLISQLRDNAREETGISSLKTGFNNVYGYYLEVTHAHKDKVPDHWIRKQTLTSAERYISPELKELEEQVLSAGENIQALERELFAEVVLHTASFAREVQRTAACVATLDVLQSFAEAACEYNFVKPTLVDSDELSISKGRHPVVEQLLPEGRSFTANDTMLDCRENRLHIITGPNMAGKSSYLRQVALIVLLAQTGSSVPADTATIGVVDSIFTRVGAQDNIAAGESTFLVEMQEAATILNNATERSLILLDEVGRGTSTFDGISIAWSIAEHVCTQLKARTLFATHYHELNQLASRYEGIRNYKVDVHDVAGTIVFTHDVVAGSADHSFGIHVAEMAGLPSTVTARAKEIMTQLEGLKSTEQSTSTESTSLNIASTDMSGVATLPVSSEDQLALFEVRDDELRRRLRDIDVNSMTPLDALTELAELVAHAKRS